MQTCVGRVDFGNRQLSEVYRQFFWMCCHGHPSPKHTMVIGNTKLLSRLNLGRLRTRAGGKPAKSKTTRRYKDKNGKTRFHGTSELKRSQRLVGQAQKTQTQGPL